MRATVRAIVMAVWAVALGAACADRPLVAAPEILQAKDKAIVFADTYVGSVSHALLHLQNDASGSHRATLTMQVPSGSSASVFSSPVATIEVQGGLSTTIELAFSPTAVGDATGTLVFTADDGSPVNIALSGTGLAPLPCSSPPECQALTFDPSIAQCVASSLPDGTACVDACLTGSTCKQGSCVGTPVDCDDQNPCTEDVCEPGAGCLHLTTLSVCPTPTDLCQVPVCSPATGCSTAAAVDGTPCGAVDCATAHVCLNGACATRAVPEGAPCGPSTPCQDQGTCHDGGCDQAPPGTTTEAWEQDLDPTATLHWLALSDANDDLYWAQVEPDAVGNQQFTLVSVARDGYPRYTEFLGTYPQGAHPHDVNLKMVGLLHDPLVVVFGQPNQLSAFHQLDGSPAWAINFSDLVSRSYHSELFTGEDDVHVAQLVDDGDELVVSLIGVSHSDATDYSWGTWVRGLSWVDGSTLWEWSMDGRSRRMVGDGLGNLYVAMWTLNSGPDRYFFANGVTNFAAIVGGAIYALSPTGLPLWDHQQTRLLDIAADGNRLFIDQMENDVGCLIDQTLEYAAAGSLEENLQTQVPWANFVYDWPMLSGGITYRLAVPSRLDCDAGTTDAWLRAFDDAAGQAEWNFGENLEASNVSAGAISSDGSVLFASASLDGMTASLRAVEPDGGEAFECPVVPFTVLTESVLQTGRWVVGGHGPSNDVVISYQMPTNLSPATSGWTASRGNMSRTNRPR